MSQFFKNLQSKITEIKPRDLLYPVITFLFAVIVCIIFFSSTKFISKNINNAFTGDIGSSEDILNRANYALVAKKLGITVATTINGVPTQAPEPETHAETIATTTQTTLDINSLTINILNSTKKSGLAGSLASELESVGYPRATVGNQAKAVPNTTITIKESKSPFALALLEEVRNIYPEATATTTKADASFDVTIVIGGK